MAVWENTLSHKVVREQVINRREKLRICTQRVKKVSVVFCTRTLLYMSSLEEFIYISRYLG